MLPVVDHERIQRLRLSLNPQRSIFQFNMNTLCIIFIFFTIIGLYKRHLDVTRTREQSHTLNTLQQSDKYHASSTYPAYPLES